MEQLLGKYLELLPWTHLGLQSLELSFYDDFFDVFSPYTSKGGKNKAKTERTDEHLLGVTQVKTEEGSTHPKISSALDNQGRYSVWRQQTGRMWNVFLWGLPCTQQLLGRCNFKTYMKPKLQIHLYKVIWLGRFKKNSPLIGSCKCNRTSTQCRKIL